MNPLRRLFVTTNFVAIFGASFLFLIGFTVFLWHSSSRQIADLEAIMDESRLATQKLEIASRLMEYARTRTRLTGQVLNTEDYFEQDALNIELEIYAGRFAEARLELIALPLSDYEEALLDTQLEIVPIILPNQREAVRLAMEGGEENLARAREILYEIVFPGQGQLIDGFLNLSNYQRNHIESLSRQYAETAQATRNRNNTLALAVLLGSLTLAYVILYRVHTIQKRIARAKDELEEMVTVRTKELNSAKDMLERVLDTIPVRVFWKNEEGTYLGANALFARDAGYTSADEVVGKRDEDMPWLEEAELYRRDDQLVMQSQEPLLAYEEPQTSSKGETIWLETNKIPLIDAQGNTWGVLGTYADITERKQAEASQARQVANLKTLNTITACEAERLEQCLEEGLALAARHLGLEIGIISHVVGGDYTVDYHVSPGHIELADGDRFILGNTYCDLTLKAGDVVAIDHMGHSKYAGHPSYSAFQLEAYIGVPFTVHGKVYGTVNFSSPTHYQRRFDDGDRELLHMLGRWAGNLYERRLAMQALTDSETRLKRSQLFGNIGTWDWDIASGKLHWSEIVAPLYGYERDLLETSYDRYLEAIHPDDRERVIAANRACIEEEVEYDIEHRVVWPNGEVHWLHESGDVVRDEHGKALNMIGVVRDITRRKESEQELQMARQQAEDANRAKSEFLSSMSHELRTPLNAILGFAQLLETEENLAREYRDNAHDIVIAGSHLLNLINEILDLSKIEAGKLELSIEPVLIDELIAAVRKLSDPLANRSGITLTFHNQCDSKVAAQVDYTRTKQVLLNLISNAIKYNREGGSVTVRCLTESPIVRIEVEDTGPGIPAQKQERLFKAFDRLGAENSTIEGTGIGLVITRELVENMGGEIGFISSEGSGTTFWIALPMSEVEARPLELANAVSTSFSNVDEEGLKQKRLLYIEDNPANLKLVSLLIQKRTKLELLTAAEPIQGIVLATGQQPDLILLDINLPEMDGYEVLRHLRANDKTRHIPVIALTANAMKDDLAKGSEAGFDAYLTKPLNVELFFETIRTFMPGQEM